MTDPGIVTVRRVSSAPPINDLDTWEQSPPVLIQRLWSGQAAPPTRHANVRLCWSEDGLHARFLCEQHEPLVISNAPVADKKTLGLWDRDVCEIFLAPNPAELSVYYEFEAAPTGETMKEA